MLLQKHNNIITDTKTNFSMVTTILSSGNWIPFLKPLAKATSLEAAILFSELCNRHEMQKRNNRLDSEGFFFATVESVYNATTIKKHGQNNAVKLLQKHGLIESELKGMPAKRHFKITVGENLANLLDTGVVGEKTTTSKTKNSQPVGENLANMTDENSITINIDKERNKIIKKDKIKSLSIDDDEKNEEKRLPGEVKEGVKLNLSQKVKKEYENQFGQRPFFPESDWKSIERFISVLEDRIKFKQKENPFPPSDDLVLSAAKFFFENVPEWHRSRNLVTYEFLGRKEKVNSMCERILAECENKKQNEAAENSRQNHNAQKYNPTGGAVYESPKNVFKDDEVKLTAAELKHNATMAKRIIKQVAQRKSIKNAS